MTNVAISNSISAQDVKRQWDQGHILLVDVRETSEYAAEHIPGSTLDPLSRFRAERYADLQEPIVLVCQSGRRAQQVAAQLSQTGIRNVRVLANGIAGWKAAGFPLERRPGAPINLQRQIQITVGVLVLLGTVLGAFLSPAWLLLSASVGAGLVYAGATGSCLLANLLARLPWNQDQ